MSIFLHFSVLTGKCQNIDLKISTKSIGNFKFNVTLTGENGKLNAEQQKFNVSS